MKAGKQKTGKLSVAVITFNEEKNIGECIKSVQDIADEIIILDSFSTDSTEKIAKKYKNVRFFKHKFTGHIEQKNRAIDLCNNKFILALDADERVSEHLKTEIQRLLKCESLKNGYKISRLTFHLGKFIRHSGWYPQKRFRLFRKGYGKWAGENPHDFVEVYGDSGSLKGDIIHYSFKDLSHQVDTINKFSSIVSFTRFRKGKKFSIMRSLFKPISKFIEIYFWKLGFLDGFAGFTIAVSSSYSTFLKEAKIYEFENVKLERPSNLKADYGNGK